MNKFLRKICLFFLLIAVIDVLLGSFMTTTSRQMNIGRNGREYYICDSVTSDILILGTSRAEHHYNAQMISDSLGIPCYNAGEEGCGIVLAYGRLLLLLERYTPNAIIYDVTPGFDYLDIHVVFSEKIKVEGKDYTFLLQKNSNSSFLLLSRAVL